MRMMISIVSIMSVVILFPITTFSSLQAVQAWVPPLLSTTTRTSTASLLRTTTRATTTTTTTTVLFAKKIKNNFSRKKNKKSGGAGDEFTTSKKKNKESTSSNAGKVQVKLLQHIAGTGQAGDVIMVKKVFFDNKLRAQKLAKMISNEEVQQDLTTKNNQQEKLLEEAIMIKDLVEEYTNINDDVSDDEATSSYVLQFLDNQTGPDGTKLFGGIGPKKLIEALQKDCVEFKKFATTNAKQVSIVDVEEFLLDPDDSKDNDDSDKPKVWGEGKITYTSSGTQTETTSPFDRMLFSSLPKKDKLTIKRTGMYRMKVALIPKEKIFVMIRVNVESK